MEEKRIYQVLIVDDEEYILQTVTSLLEEQTEYELEIFQANSVSVALSTLHRRRIDVLLTDIQMPFTSGLQLAHIVRKRWPDCKTIILTAHADFSFAHQAMQEEIFGYVLKSEPDARLLEVFNKAIEKINTEQERIEYLAEVQTVSSHQINFLKHQTFCRLLNGAYLHSSDNYRMALSALGCPEPEKPLVLICLRISQTDLSETQANQLQYLSNRYLSSSDCFTYYGLVDGALYCLCQPHQQQAAMALRDALSMVVDNFFASTRQAAICLISPDFEDCATMCELVQRIKTHCVLHNDAPYVHLMSQNAANSSYAAQTLAQVKDYISQNVFQDVSLETLASLVGYNASYLSRLFLKKTGKNLSSYIADTKMERISQLLANPDYTLDQIAEISGFDNRSNFNRFVKRITGLSPKRLREQYSKVEPSGGCT